MKNNPRGGTSKFALLTRKREERAVTLRLQGMTLDAIAKEVGYATHQGVRFAIFRAMARLPAIEDVLACRQQELAKLDEVEREAWEQWHRSTQDAETRTTSQTKDGPVITDKAEGQSGNPALLDKIIKCSERRAKLLGLDAPEKLAVTSQSDIRVIGQNAADVLEAAAKKARGNVAGK